LLLGGGSTVCVQAVLILVRGQTVQDWVDLLRPDTSKSTASLHLYTQYEALKARCIIHTRQRASQPGLGEPLAHTNVYNLRPLSSEHAQCTQEVCTHVCVRCLYMCTCDSEELVRCTQEVCISVCVRCSYMTAPFMRVSRSNPYRRLRTHTHTVIG